MTQQKFKHKVGMIFAPNLNELQRVLNEGYSDCHTVSVTGGYTNAKSAQEIVDGLATPGYLVIGTQADDD